MHPILEKCAEIYPICGGTFEFIKEEINKHDYYTDQMWIDEYYRLKEVIDNGNDD